jgi:hypothetical protein
VLTNLEKYLDARDERDALRETQVIIKQLSRPGA